MDEAMISSKLKHLMAEFTTFIFLPLGTIQLYSTVSRCIFCSSESHPLALAAFNIPIIHCSASDLSIS